MTEILIWLPLLACCAVALAVRATGKKGWL